ncbi:MAG: SRPBCC family protein [Mariprofundus sp.]|nr:SRPBCC family protein [Mariprofundus sp.]
MSVIKETYELNASPEAVFDLINDVEKTSDYSDFLQGVRKTGPDMYRYTVNIAGIPLSWDAKVCERKRPERIAWVSVHGITLAGSFTLKPIPAGTMVFFSMEYSITNRFLAMVLRPFIPPLVRAVASEIIAHIKQRL